VKRWLWTPSKAECSNGLAHDENPLNSAASLAEQSKMRGVVAQKRAALQALVPHFLGLPGARACRSIVAQGKALPDQPGEVRIQGESMAYSSPETDGRGHARSLEEFPIIAASVKDSSTRPCCSPLNTLAIQGVG
jgi:hypothetical protein